MNMPRTSPDLDRSARIAHLGTISERAALAGEVDGVAPVEHCGDWLVDDLIVHLADVQWFWTDIIERGVTAYEDVRRPDGLVDGVAPSAYLRSQSRRLVTALKSTNDADVRWSWWPPDQTVGFTVTRQLIEAAVHCWDAEHAVGLEAPIFSDVAVVGLQEFVDVMAHDFVDGLAPSVAINLAPDDSPWRGRLFPEAAGGETMTGTASDVLLALWGRRPVNEAIATSLAAVDLS